MKLRKTALYQTRPRTDWGGSYADSTTWASKFRSYAPYDFGVMGAQTFSTQLGKHVVNKPFMWLTQGQGNVYELPGGHNDYQWTLAEDGNTIATITDVDTSLPTRPGELGQTFRICLDRNYYHEPILLATEGRDEPLLKIHGYPVEESPTKFWYTVSVQDGSPSAFVQSKYLQTLRTVRDAGTQVSDELNDKYAGIEFGSEYNLRSHIGYVARKIEVTDKFIRLEKASREKGMAPTQSYSFNGKKYNNAVGTGYMIAQRMKPGEKPTTQQLKAGAFITTAEAMLEERLAMDKEWGMTFGRVQITKDSDSGRTIKTGAGWLQMAKEGNYQEHNYNLTLNDFTDRLEALHYNSVDPSDRKIYVRTGQDGIKFASQLIANEAGSSPFTYYASFAIDDVNHNQFGNEKGFGYQFTEFRGYNGQVLCFVYDPTKDSPYWYPELHPETNRPIESGSFDILDLGNTSAAPADSKTRSNMAMITEPEAEEYFMVSNVYDLQTGSVKDGSNVAMLNKEAGIYRASSYKLEIWDISRTMRLAAVA